MAKTKKGNKIVCVGGYTKSNGTKVKGHRRSTPKKEKSMLENVAEKAATSFGRSIANALARGILGSLLKK